jgi:thioredoxin 1
MLFATCQKNMQVNDKNFEEEVLKFDGVVLVDFFATWCTSCQSLAPILEELSRELNESEIKIVTLNVDESPTMTEKYEILGLPTLIVFKKGEVVDTMHGLQNKGMLKEKLEMFSK